MFRYYIVSNFLQVAISLEVYSLEKYTGKMKKDKKLCKKKNVYFSHTKHNYNVVFS